MRYGETLLVIAYTDVNLMAAKEPLLQEDGDVSFKSVSSVSSEEKEEESHEAPQVSFSWFCNFHLYTFRHS